MWKNTISFPRLEVTKEGRVRQWHKSWNRYVEKTQRHDKDGYLIISTRNEKGKTTTARVHRLVAEAYIPNIDNKPIVNHLNGVKDDNRVENLRWSTVAENTQHAYDELGIVSAQSQKVVLVINGVPFSTYDSINKLCEKVGIDRGSMPRLEEISNKYFSHFRVEDNYAINGAHDKDVWTESKKLNTRGAFFKLGDSYYNSVQDIAKLFSYDRTTIYTKLRDGNIKNIPFTEVSCEEYLRNSLYRNW